MTAGSHRIAVGGPGAQAARAATSGEGEGPIALTAVPSFTMLGRIRLEQTAGTELDALLRQPKRLALLAYLALPQPGIWHRRDTVLGIFWPDLETVRARSALRNALYVLRQHLGEGVVRTRGDEDVSLDPERFTTDAALFETEVAAGELGSALERYRGDLLPGLFVPEAEEFEKWLDQERRRLHGLALRAAVALAAERDGAGDLPGAIRAAARAWELDPDHEPALRRLMELHDRAGAPAQALAAYQQFQARMAAEFSAEPSPTTAELAHRIRSRRQPTKVAPPLGGLLPPLEEEPGPNRTDNAASRALPAPRPAARVGPRLLVAGALLAAVAILTLLLWHPRRAPSAVARSLVVLPMENATGDTGLAYLATGIGEAVVGRLRSLGALATIRSAARAQWPTATRQDVGLVGREFGAELALRSRIARDGDSLSVAAEVVDIRSGAVRRAGTFPFSVRAVVDLESRLAAAVAGAAFRRPLPEEPRASAHRVDPESYRLTLKGWHQMLTAQNQRAAARLFDQATRLDPTNARAWAGISSTWAAAAITWGMPFEEGAALAEAAAARALALDSLQATALANLGVLRGLRDRDLAEGERFLARAAVAEPGNPEVFLIEAALYRHAWQWDRARDAIRIARQLDPLSALYVEREGNLALCADQPDRAVQLYGEALRLDASAPGVRDGMARALARLGRWDEALATLRAAGDENGHDAPAPPAARGEAGYWAYRAALTRPRLTALLAEARRGWISRARLGTLYVAVGETDRGLDLLEAEARAGDIGILRLPCQPDVDRARRLPRFRALLELVSRVLPR
jgi:DNA-binding SARP family transcriptional activator/TolB-like protein